MIYTLAIAGTQVLVYGFGIFSNHYSYKNHSLYISNPSIIFTGHIWVNI